MRKTTKTQSGRRGAGLRNVPAPGRVKAVKLNEYRQGKGPDGAYDERQLRVYPYYILTGMIILSVAVAMLGFIVREFSK